MPLTIKHALKWTPSRLRMITTRDSLSLFQRPPPPGNSAMTHQVSCLQLRSSCVLRSVSTLLFRHPTRPIPGGPPFWPPPNFCEIAAKSEGVEILVQNSFITAKINLRRLHLLTHVPSLLLLWQCDMALCPCHHVLTSVQRLCVCVTWIVLTCLRGHLPHC